MPSEDPILMPNGPPRTLGLVVDWFKLDIPATVKGEPLYCTGWECECGNGGRCSCPLPVDVVGKVLLEGNMAEEDRTMRSELEVDTRHDERDLSLGKRKARGVDSNPGIKRPRDVIYPIAH